MTLRRALRVHPEWPAALLAAAAWPLALSGSTVRATGSTPAHGHGTDVTAAVIAGLPHWSVMTVAMMLPIALPAVRHVGRNSLRRRRRRAMAAFLLGYLMVWLLFGAAALALADAVRPAAVGLLALAALWPFTLWHRRMRAGCHRTLPLPPSGFAATRADIRFGLQHGVYCTVSCAPAMLAMAALLHNGVLPMLATTVLLTAARFLPARYLRVPLPLLRRWRSAWRSVRVPSPPPPRDPSGERWSPSPRAGAG